MSDQDDYSSNRSNSYQSEEQDDISDYPQELYDQNHPDEDNDLDGDIDEQAIDTAFKVFDEKAVSQKFKEELNLKPLAIEERMTYPIITKYEYAKVIGMRAAQIAANSPIYIKLTEDQIKGISAMIIAQLQFQQKKIPYIIRRVHPNGYYEDWQIRELENLCN